LSDIDWHREMLCDRHRVTAFRQAVKKAVSPGDVVVDIGTGTGLLALLAIEAGAARVYAIERGEIIVIARQIARQNGLDDRVSFIRGDSRQVEIGERADLVMGELIGSLGLDEDIITIFCDARERFLKPGGRLLPDSLDLIVAPTEEGETQAAWKRDFESECGLDFSPFTELSQHRTLGLWADPDKLLAPGSALLRCDFHRDTPAILRGEVETDITRSGILTGWVSWFVARYRGLPFLTTRPPIDGSSWENVVFPTGDSVAVSAGDCVRLKLRRDNPFWGWETQFGEGEWRTFGEIYGVPPRDLVPRED